MRGFLLNVVLLCAILLCAGLVQGADTPNLDPVGVDLAVFAAPSKTVVDVNVEAVVLPKTSPPPGWVCDGKSCRPPAREPAAASSTKAIVKSRTKAVTRAGVLRLGGCDDCKDGLCRGRRLFPRRR